MLWVFGAKNNSIMVFQMLVRAIFLACWIGAALAQTSYTLALKWPRGFCEDPNITCKQQPSTSPYYFTLHGLWPNNGTGQVRTYTLFEPVPYRLEKYWIDLRRKNYTQNKYQQFWKHEWNKHGTFTAFNQSAYFNQSLSLRDKYDPTVQLSNQNITANGTYDSANISAALKGWLHVDVRLICWMNNNKTYLHEIRMCFNGTFGAVNCTSESRNCGNRTEY